MSIDPETLMAYVDGELDETQRRTVEQTIAADPALAAELERQQGLRATLTSHYGPVAQEQVPDRLRSLLGAGPNVAVQDGNVVSLAEARTRRSGWPVWRNLGAIAASLAVGVMAGQLLPLGREPVATQHGSLVAQGDLANALERQLASAQAADAPTRIGLTFADHQGRACRTFEGRAFAGLACRTGGRWQIVTTAASEAAEPTLYRQAGSSPIMATAQQMMASPPLDAEAERAAVQGGWKVGK